MWAGSRKNPCRLSLGGQPDFHDMGHSGIRGAVYVSLVAKAEQSECHGSSWWPYLGVGSAPIWPEGMVCRPLARRRAETPANWGTLGSGPTKRLALLWREESKVRQGFQPDGPCSTTRAGKPDVNVSPQLSVCDIRRLRTLPNGRTSTCRKCSIGFSSPSSSPLPHSYSGTCFETARSRRGKPEGVGGCERPFVERLSPHPRSRHAPCRPGESAGGRVIPVAVSRDLSLPASLVQPLGQDSCGK